MTQPQAEFLDLYRAGLKSAADLMKVSLQSAEKLQNQQLVAIRTALDQQAKTISELGQARSIDELLAVQNEVTRQLGAEMIGRTVEVMVEGPSGGGGGDGVGYGASVAANGNGFALPISGRVELGARLRPLAGRGGAVQLVGRTRGDQIVHFEAEARLAGELVDVEITAARGLSLFGRRSASP